MAPVKYLITNILCRWTIRKLRQSHKHQLPLVKANVLQS